VTKIRHAKPRWRPSEPGVIQIEHRSRRELLCGWHRLCARADCLPQWVKSITKQSLRRSCGISPFAGEWHLLCTCFVSEFPD
jgi:hypothetical protein